MPIISVTDFRKRGGAQSTKAVRTTDLEKETVAAMMEADLSHLPAGSRGRPRVVERDE